MTTLTAASLEKEWQEKLKEVSATPSINSTQSLDFYNDIPSCSLQLKKWQL